MQIYIVNLGKEESMKINKELLKGSTSMLILSILEEKNMYGYQMIKELEKKSNNIFELKEGTLYPILHLLEEKNYISSYWDESTSKKRKYYSITKDGRKILKSKKEEWKFYTTGVNHVIGGVLFEY